jgi:methyl-accepting chemotaxis protein
MLLNGFKGGSMAEVEFGDVKVSGGKLLLIIPLLGSIAGALWGGFELYQRLLDAEEAVTNYVAPDMSGINQQLAVQAETIEAISEEVTTQFETLNILVENLQEDVDRIREDVDEIDNFVRNIDESTNETQRDLRNDVYAMEETLNDRMREIDEQLRETRDDLEESIERILDNPLNDSE